MFPLSSMNHILWYVPTQYIVIINQLCKSYIITHISRQIPHKASTTGKQIIQGAAVDTHKPMDQLGGFGTFLRHLSNISWQYLPQTAKNASNRGRDFNVKIRYHRPRIARRRVQKWKHREKWG